MTSFSSHNNSRKTDSHYLPQHPSVSECCVLGLPDKDYGEVVCAIVVPNANGKKEEEAFQPIMSLGELQDWAKDKLAPYKVSCELVYGWEFCFYIKWVVIKTVIFFNFLLLILLFSTLINF